MSTVESRGAECAGRHRCLLMELPGRVVEAIDVVEEHGECYDDEAG